MTRIKEQARAFGQPGIEPRWTRGNRNAVGTAYSASSRLWFTLSGGILNEVYYPTIDKPQIRDLQYLITDGESFFFHDERRHLDSTTRELSQHALGYEITIVERERRYGQRADGGPFEGWGKGRVWPLLTGERGHYEFAARRDVTLYLLALEGFANSTGLLPEQVGDEPDRPELHLRFGGQTGAATH